MKKLLIAATLLFLLIPGISGAQGFIHFYPPNSLPLTGGTLTGPLLLPDGTAANTSMGFLTDGVTGNGLYRSAGNQWSWSISSLPRVSIDLPNQSLRLSSAATVGWSSTTSSTAALDLMLTRGGVATLQQGAADAASPVNQTLQAQGVAAGTSDTAGANYMIRPGLGRGSAVPAAIELGRYIMASSGSTAQLSAQALTVCGSKTLSNTSAVAQAVMTISTPAGFGGGGTMFYTVFASDGTNVNAETGSVHVSWGNKTGAVSATLGTPSDPVQDNDSGTLAATPTATVATSVVTLKLTPTWVTIVPTSVRTAITYFNNGYGTVACQ